MTTPSSAIQSTLVENRVFEPSAATVAAARISGMDSYHALCAEAEQDFEGFWAKRAREHLSWHKPFTQTLDSSNAPFYQWFADGELNASFNCLDRHMGTPVENKTAIIFEADGGEVTQVSYKELLAKVSQFANVLKSKGVQKGDRVVIYMPMTVEGVIAMQASERNGALVGAIRVLPSDEMMLISDQGTLLRTVVDQISLLSRNTQGVKVMNVRDGETLVGMARIAEAEGAVAAHEDENEDEDGAGAADPADG